MATDPKDVMRRYYEQAWNGRDVAVLDDLLAPDFVNHSPFAPGLPTGPEGVPMVMQALWAAFPDLRFTVEDQVGEGELVASRTVLRGTHQGELFGVPATFLAVEVPLMSFERVVDGRIVEHWRVSDDLGLMRQLGALP